MTKLLAKTWKEVVVADFEVLSLLAVVTETNNESLSMSGPVREFRGPEEKVEMIMALLSQSVCITYVCRYVTYVDIYVCIYA